MVKSITTEKNPRIACYKVPAETLTICALLLGATAIVRFLGNNQIHQIVDTALSVLFVVTALNFLIPFVRPNSILGGAKLRTFALASFTLLGLVVIH
jgi:hypothetical protein